MKGWVSISIGFFFTQLVLAQNLVRNPSFEEGEEDFCNPLPFASMFRHYVFHWSGPTGGTPDIFSSRIVNKSCWAAMPSTTPGVGPRIGSQAPRTGQRFAGIYTYIDWGYREYMQVELFTPLVPGEYYCASMYVSLADEVQMASNNLGFYLYEDFILESSNLVYDAQPQVNETTVIQDITNWTRVYGKFQATGPFRHMSIGNFLTNENTKVVLQQGRGAHYPEMAYYFVDDVSIEKLPNELLFTGNTTICEGQSTILSVVQALEEVTWTTLTDTTTTLSTTKSLEVSPAVTTMFRIKGKLCKSIFVDTVSVTVLPFIQPHLGDDIIKCVGDAVQLDAGESYTAFLWQDNSTDRYLRATTAGTYSVRVTNEHGCTGSSSISIEDKTPPKVDLGEDVTLCNDAITLQVEAGHTTYTWSTGDTGVSIKPRTSGKYWVTVTNECGVSSDTVRVYSFDDIFIPNVITLNHDDINEAFEITGLTPGIYPSLKIVDRWGREVISKNDYRGDWPGSNSNLPSGTYYYIVSFSGCRSYKGWINLLR